MNQDPPTDTNLSHDLIPAPEDSLSLPVTAPKEDNLLAPEAPQTTFTPPAAWSQDESQAPGSPEPPPIYPLQPQSPTSSQSVLPEAPAPNQPQTKSSFLRYFLIAVALILLGILIGVLAARFLPLTPASSVPSVTPTPSALLTPSVTAPVSTSSAESVSASTASGEVLGWKTYSNSSLGYSLKYPQNTGWYVDEGRYTTTIYNYDVKTAPGRSYDPVADKGMFKIEIASDSSFKNCDLWLSDYSQTPSVSTDKVPEIMSLKRIVNNNITGLSFETESLSDLIGLSCLNNPNGGLLFLNGFLDYSDFKTIYSQIISSVSFAASGTPVTK